MLLRTFVFCLAASSLVVSAQPLHLQLLGSYKTNIYLGSASEIPAYDAATKRVFVVNFTQGRVDVLSIADPANPTLVFSIIPPASCGSSPNSVAVKNGIVAIANESAPKTDPGYALFTDTDGLNPRCVQVGALPDMLTFTPDGTKVLVANEGEPNDSYSIDPEGSVSIVDISGGLGTIDQSKVRTATFTAFNAPAAIDPNIRIFGPGATVAQDLEPEYIAISADSKTAYVALQEANAIGVLDIDAGVFTRLAALGFKDHSLPGNGLDPSDRDLGINIANWPVFGMYNPDAIATFQSGGQTYIVSANEGDARSWGGFSEETRVNDSDYVLDPAVFPDPAFLKNNARLGRLTVTTATGDDNGDGMFERIMAFGARSFSIWNADIEQVFDSGDQLETLTSKLYPSNFNANNEEENTPDNRSDNKGPEPEAVTIGELDGVPHAFVGLERIGGVMVYSLANPEAPEFRHYSNNRNFSVAPEAGTLNGTVGDLGVEATVFIPPADSPNGKPLLVVANEVSGSTSIFEVKTLNNLAGKISAQLGGTVLNRLTNIWFATITIRNTSGAALSGPFYGAFDNLPAQVELVNKAGLLPSGSYTQISPVESLAPGASLQVRVEFRNPVNAPISFVPSFYN